MSNEVTTTKPSAIERHRTSTVDQLAERMEIVKRVAERLMHEEEHYGVIPGTQKPTLYQAGAQLLAATFRLTPRYDVETTDLEGGHRAYYIECELTTPDGQVCGRGVGECSTMESKFKRPNPYDMWTTCLKMGKKRSFVDAVITATACGDKFTQDLSDGDELEGATKKARPTIKPVVEASEGEKASGTVDSLVATPGETKGRKWTRHDLVVDGKKYSTFQKSSVEGVKAGDLVEVTFKAQGNNLVLLAVKVAEMPGETDEEVPY